MGRHRKQRSWFWAWFPAVLIALWLAIWGSLASSSAPTAFQRPTGVIISPEHVFHPRAATPAKLAAPMHPAITKLVTVTQGETLWSLARQYCGNGNDYKNMMRKNGLKTWLIKPGQKVTIAC